MASDPLPPDIAEAFNRDMRAFFATRSKLEQDENAARQLRALNAFRRRRGPKLRLADIKAMFLEFARTGGR